MGHSKSIHALLAGVRKLETSKRTTNSWARKRKILFSQLLLVFLSFAVKSNKATEECLEQTAKKQVPKSKRREISNFIDALICM